VKGGLADSNNRAMGRAGMGMAMATYRRLGIEVELQGKAVLQRRRCVRRGTDRSQRRLAVRCDSLGPVQLQNPTLEPLLGGGQLSMSGFNNNRGRSGGCGSGPQDLAVDVS